MIFPCVDGASVASVVADWTGIPVRHMAKNELEQVLKLADVLEKRVIGQRHALEMISATRTLSAGPGSIIRTGPVGVFMLVRATPA